METKLVMMPNTDRFATASASSRVCASSKEDISALRAFSCYPPGLGRKETMKTKGRECKETMQTKLSMMPNTDRSSFRVCASSEEGISALRAFSCSPPSSRFIVHADFQCIWHTIFFERYLTNGFSQTRIVVRGAEARKDELSAHRVFSCSPPSFGVVWHTELPNTDRFARRRSDTYLHSYICVYIHMFEYTYTYLCIYVYIYIERRAVRAAHFLLLPT